MRKIAVAAGCSILVIGAAFITGVKVGGRAPTGIVEEDVDGDGEWDSRFYYSSIRAGDVEKVEYDMNRDGIVDLTCFYPEGHMTRYNADWDFDGRVDVWTRVEHERTVQEERDLDGDGIADVVTRYESDRPRTVLYMPGGGKVVGVGFFKGGRVVRDFRDHDGDGRFEKGSRFSLLGEYQGSDELVKPLTLSELEALVTSEFSVQKF